MMTGINHYHLPATLSDALALLSHHNGAARVIGGGTDYFVDDARESGHDRPEALVDVTRMTGWQEVARDGEFIVIGCGATHSQIVASPLIRVGGTALMESCGLIGGPQVRNVGTLTGNIAHALPAADGTLALLALGGEIAVAGGTAESPALVWMPLSLAFRGPGKSAIDSARQIIVAARFVPTGADEGSAFARIMRPQGVALPIAGLACRVKVRDGVIASVAIAAGPVAPTPFRAAQTEVFLAGKPASLETIESAADVLLNESKLRTSPHRATAEYRREVLPVLLREAMLSAIARAKATV
ncbi:MAG: FAD binding domain-containing protein [Thermoflexales bacterium]